MERLNHLDERKPQAGRSRYVVELFDTELQAKGYFQTWTEAFGPERVELRLGNDIVRAVGEFVSADL